MITRRSAICVLALLAVAVGFAASVSRLAAQAPIEENSAATDKSGNIHVPSNYRREFEFLGSWAIAADNHQGSKQIHVVYASPGTSGAYRSTGAFPDGTILVKEVYAASTDELTTGTVSRADKLNGWFVMVRDSKDAHPGNALWGDGWGWSWFDAGEPAKTTTVSYRDECQACHIPARASSWIYVNGYPPLR
jgi:Cytochrome P460